MKNYVFIFVAHLQVNVKRWTGGGRLPSSQRLVFGILPPPTKVRGDNPLPRRWRNTRRGTHTTAPVQCSEITDEDDKKKPNGPETGEAFSRFLRSTHVVQTWNHCNLQCFLFIHVGFLLKSELAAIGIYKNHCFATTRSEFHLVKTC